MALRSATPLLDTFGAAVWRADTLAARADGVALASGHAALDVQLPGGGWPVGGLCEILQAPDQHNEWRLLLPALRRQTRQVVLVAAPCLPFGPGLAAQGLNLRALLWVKAEALAQRLWAAEQALRCAGVAALLLWLPQVRSDHLRRLHLAAQAHGKLLFVMRPEKAQAESSPAVLRLLLEAPAPGSDPASADALGVQILKRRGPPLAQSLSLPARPGPLRVLLAVAASQRCAAVAQGVAPGLNQGDVAAARRAGLALCEGSNSRGGVAANGFLPPGRLAETPGFVERQDAMDRLAASA